MPNLVKVIGPRRLKKILFKTPIKDILSGKKYIFHHLQKCGGTSLKKSLEDHFILKKDYSVTGEPPVNFESLLPCDLLVGHFELTETVLFDRYPNVLNKNVFLFSMLRDPFELKVSLYYYWKKHHKVQEESLKDFMLSRNNYLAHLLYCNEMNWQDNLNRYDFIGILEKYQESLAILSTLTARDIKNYQVENTSKRDAQFSDLIDNKEFMTKFRQQNSLDYKIYNYAAEQFVKKWSDV